MPMTELTFSTEELLEQAKGNETGLWHVTVLWAKEQPGGIDGWASLSAERLRQAGTSWATPPRWMWRALRDSTSRRRPTCGRLT